MRKELSEQLETIVADITRTVLEGADTITTRCVSNLLISMNASTSHEMRADTLDEMRQGLTAVVQADLVVMLLDRNPAIRYSTEFLACLRRFRDEQNNDPSITITARPATENN